MTSKKDMKSKKENDGKKVKEEEMPDVIDPGEIVEEVLDEAEEEPQLLKKQNDELVDKLQRSLAEFDNFRKRTIKEKSEMHDFGVITSVEKILPAVDNLERALQTATDKEDGMYKGVSMIYKQLLTALEDLGVSAIVCVGEAFDPNLHNAVAHEQNEGCEENIVIEELQKGYKFKDKVIRPSMVKVAN